MTTLPSIATGPAYGRREIVEHRDHDGLDLARISTLPTPGLACRLTMEATAEW